MEPLSWDYILKYVIVGDSAVGKSSLLVRLTDDRFSEAGTEPTLGVEFGSRILDCGRGRKVKVQCWDTAGTESFRSITRSYFRGAAGALLVYDVTRRDSFDHVVSWLSDLKQHADEDVSIILVANKTDLCSTSSPSVPQVQYGQPFPAPQAPIRLSTSSGSSQAAAHSAPPQETADQEAVEAEDPARSQETNPNLKPRAVSTLDGVLFAREHGLLYVETSAKEGWGVVDAFEWTAREVLDRIRGKQLGKKPGGVKLDAQERKGGKCC